MHHRSCSRVLLASLLLCAAAGMTPASVTPPPLDRPADLGEIGRHLPARPTDPLASFHLSLALSPQELARLASVDEAEQLKAGPDTYHRFATPPSLRDEAAGLPAPDGLSVLAADFFFVNGERLVEASLIVRASLGPGQALATFKRQYGAPDFMVVLPGALDLAVGWRMSDGCLLAWFSDLDIFRATVFRADAHDLLAGSQLVLYDGLMQYAERLAAGASAQELAGDLMKAVTWAAMARASLEPVR